MLALTSISPDIGGLAGGTVVTLTGTDFQVGMLVFFDGSLADSITVFNATLATCTTPSHAAGAVDVEVDNPDTSQSILSNGFRYLSQAALDYAYSTETTPQKPVAIAAPAGQDTVVGAVVRLDGRASFSPTGLSLSYSWAFMQVPIGSQAVANGFKDLEDDSSVVSFAPDVTGLYVIELVVNDGSFNSDPTSTEVNTKVVLVPQNLGIVPDASWVWNFLSDFWNRVEQRTRFETFWSAAIQIIAAEQLKLWQYDYNKSIQDIQELIQKRWINYQPALPLDATQATFILAEDQAGLNASTFLIDITSNAPQTLQPQLSNLVTVPVSEGSFSKTAYGSSIAAGRLLQLDELSFTLSRSGVATRSVNHASDGSVIAAGNTFHGSAFSSDLVGMYLRILGGPAAGTYVILTFTDSHTIIVKNLDGTTTVFPSSPSGLSYSIFPATPNCNSFFANQNLVPTQQMPLPWRFSSTLISTQYDFESQGVSPGDVLAMQVTRTDTARTSTINAQIVSVDRGRVGFVFNTMDLVDGAASTSLSAEDQTKLANDLQVAGLMVSMSDGSLVYTDQALQVKTAVKSVSFKRQVFETTLSPTSTINVGPFSVTVTPLKIVRNSKVLIDSTIKSIPSLQEYVKQPNVAEVDGSLVQISEGKLYPLARRPYVVYENADYVVDDDTAISGTCSVLSGSDLVTVPFGDLLDRGIRQGDTIEITDGARVESFRILAIASPTSLRVSPVVDFTGTAVRFTVSRDVVGTFIRFVDGTFTKSSPAPDRLWAEVTFLDNEVSVEKNFGVLVGVLRSDLSSVGATISYKNAVAGLMYALTNGPTIANLQLASQILLGLPFTTSAGTITEIDPTFKINSDGSPLLGRILVAAEDNQGKLIGITNIYFYPQGRQIPDPNNPGEWLPATPDLSGLAVNPETGVEYRVGDHVDRFVALSKGTQVQDYLSDTALVQEALNQGNTAFALQRYHSFRLTVSADVVSAVDTDLVAQFIKKAKPTYTKLSMALAKGVEDEVDVSDRFFVSLPVFVKDNESLSLPASLSFDPQSVESSFLTADGNMFEYRISGSDLVTTNSSLIVSSAAGGFVNARAGESHDTPFLLPGHILKITAGDNENYYVIASVTDDNTIVLQSTDFEGVAVSFETQANQSFAIYKLTTCLIVRGTGTVTHSSQTVNSSIALFSAGVAVGDLVVLSTSSAAGLRVYRCIDINTSGQLTLNTGVVETTGSYTISVYRSGLINKYYGYKTGATPLSLTLSTSGGHNLATVLAGSTDHGLATVAQPGDILVTSDGQALTILDFNGAAFTVEEAISAGTVTALLMRPGRADTNISIDALDRVPDDYLSLTMERRSIGAGGAGQDLTTTSGSDSVSTVSGVNFDTGLGVRVGDYLVVLEGADASVDVGFGTGIFPIQQVSGTSLVLTRNLSATHASPGILYGIQRRRSNER